jgi:sec-independent protein translocase protein TatC
MASEGEVERPEYEEDEEGGPVKTFLEHLEDLRWVLIKSCAAVAVGMILCLIGADFIIRVLKHPLDKADRWKQAGDKQTTVNFFIGTNLWGSFKPGVPALGQLALASNGHAAFQLVAVNLESNQVLALQPVTNAALLEWVNNKPTLLRNLSPVGGFWVAFQVAMYGGIVVTSPALIWIIGQFILPALKIKEKKYALRGFAIGTGLFLAGVAFCYFALMPVALRASAQYSQWLGFSADEWRAEDYISFVCKFMLGMGLGFEMPVVLLTLVKIGILSYSSLASFRRYMIVINLILGALLTTPEVLTQVLMFIPLQLLYEISIWIAWWWERKERRLAAQEGPGANP